MNGLNNLILEGELTEHAVVKEVNGMKVALLKMSYSREIKGTDKVENSVFEIERYGRLAEVCETQCDKGRGIRVVGRLKQSVWFDGDEVQHSRVFVVAEHMEFKPRKVNKEN